MKLIQRLGLIAILGLLTSCFGDKKMTDVEENYCERCCQAYFKMFRYMNTNVPKPKFRFLDWFAHWIAK